MRTKAENTSIQSPDMQDASEQDRVEEGAGDKPIQPRGGVIARDQGGAHGRASVWRTYSRYRWLVAAITAAIVLVVVVLSLLRPPIYTAEARLAVGSGQMTALNIPGYPTASEEMASDYARYVANDGVQGGVAPAGTLSLTASPIIESNVLRIEATSESEDVAVEAVDQASAELKKAVNEVSAENDPERLLEEIQGAIEDLTLARQRENETEGAYRSSLDRTASQDQVDQALERWVDAQTDLVALELEQDGRRDRYRNLVATSSTEADLVDVSPATIVGNDRAATVQRNSLLAVLTGLGISAVVVLILERRRSRPLAESAARKDDRDSEQNAALRGHENKSTDDDYQDDRPEPHGVG